MTTFLARSCTAVVVAAAIALGSGACGGGPGPATPAEQDPIPLVGPPAGVQPCAGNGATDARAAALACYESRVKPALGALVKSQRLSQFSFGSADYLKSVLAIAPDARVETTARLPDTQAEAIARTTVLGDRGMLGMSTKVVQVTIVLRAAGTPSDGDMQLAFFVNPQSFEVVYVHRILGG